jgi:predicted dehydrogenase
VLLCLPHLLHAPATVAAARAGKHVLVEKPIATTLDDADAMIAAAEAAGVTLMVAHNQRFFPEHQRIRELLDEDAIGPVYCARADHNQDFIPPETHWIRRREEAGGGAFIGYGVHRIDLLRWFAGEVTEVAHFQHSSPGRFDGETSSVTILKFEGGAIGEIAVNWTVRHPPWMDMLFLYGEGGSIHNVGGLLLDSHREPATTRIEVGKEDPFALQLRHFAGCVLNRAQPLTSGVDARRTLEVCLAGYRSAATGQVVRLSGRK